jgi:hypothetical protein
VRVSGERSERLLGHLRPGSPVPSRRVPTALLGKVVDRVSTASEPITVPGFHGTHTGRHGGEQRCDLPWRRLAGGPGQHQVLTAAGFGQPSWVIDGFDQAVRRDARIASLSLGWSEIDHGLSPGWLKS